jgi:hypothetical protein
MKITRKMLKPFPAEIPGTPKQWERIAAAFELPKEKRSATQHGIAMLGLCNAAAIVIDSRSYKLFSSMAHAKCRTSQDEDYWFDFDRDGDLNRAAVARLIAAELRRRAK